MHPDTLQTAVQVTTQAIGETFWIELLKLAIFSVFVSATLEVLKETCLRFNPAGINTQTIKILNFLLALTFCYVFDYGIMMRVIQGGVKLKGNVAPFFDYTATASVIYKGADWTFDKFAAMKAKLVAAKRASEADPIVTKTTDKSSVVTEEKSKVVEEVKQQ